MNHGGRAPIDFSIRFSRRGTDFGVHLDGDGESPERHVAWQDLAAVAADFERLRAGGEDLAPETVEDDEAGGAGGDRSELARLGRRLFECLFSAADRPLFVRAADASRREGRPLRLLVRLGHGSRLERIPWEILHDGDRFVAKDARSSIVRYFNDRQERPAFQVAPPVRVLITSACPPPHAPLHLDAEIAAVLRAYRGAEGLVRPVVHRNVSLKCLEDLWQRAEVRKQPFHVWHHCGHGHHTTAGGEPRFLLSLESRGDAEYVTVDQLSEVVGTCPGLRLAILNVCHGGSAGGPVAELARLNVPVVIGYPSRVANDMAYRFAAALHGNLLQVPVELAVSLARRALASVPAMALEWSQPMVCSRRRDWGPILRWPAPVPAAVPRGGRSNDVAVRVKGLRARGDVTVVGFESTGTGPEPGRVKVEAEDIDAASIVIRGVRLVGGYSDREIALREQQTHELLGELATSFAEGAGRHEQG